MELLILAGVFFGTVLAILAAYNAVNRRELQAAETARELLRRGTAATGDNGRGILRDPRTSEIPLLHKLLAGRELTARRVGAPAG
jgi:hypothetical protein